MDRLFILLIMCSMFSFMGMNAQEAQTGKYSFDSKVLEVAPGVSIVLPGKTNDLKAVVDQRINDETNKSLKKFRKKTYQVEDVKIAAISGDQESYYFKIDRQGQDQSRLTLFIANKEEGFVAKEDNEGMIQRAMEWMEKFPYELEVYQKSQIVASDAKELNNLEKKMEKLKKQEEKLKKQLEENEKALRDMEKRMENAKDDAVRSMDELQRMRKKEDPR